MNAHQFRANATQLTSMPLYWWNDYAIYFFINKNETFLWQWPVYISFHFDSSLFTLNDAVCIVERRTKSESDKSLNCHFHSLFTVYVYRSSCLVCVHFAFFSLLMMVLVKMRQFRMKFAICSERRRVDVCFYIHKMWHTNWMGVLCTGWTMHFSLRTCISLKSPGKHSAGTDGRQTERQAEWWQKCEFLIEIERKLTHF